MKIVLFPFLGIAFEINTCTLLVPHFILKIFALETEGYVFWPKLLTLESTCMAIIWKNGEWLYEVLLVCISCPKIKALKRALKNKIGDNWNNVENKFVKGHYPIDVIMKSWGHKDLYKLMFWSNKWTFSNGFPTRKHWVHACSTTFLKIWCV